MADINKKDFIYGLGEEDKKSVLLESVRGELEDGLKIFDKRDKIISVFGSARARPEDKIYKDAEKVGASLARAGFAVLTGGGPGIMEAAAKGAFNAKGKTYGVNIILPREQGINSYISAPYVCRYFFTRKILLMRYSLGFVVMPGGFGTMDELFEVFTLMATDVSPKVPVVLFGRDYWGGLADWIKNETLRMKYIEPWEADFIRLADDADEVIKILLP